QYGPSLCIDGGSSFCRRTDGRLGDAGSGKSPVCLTMRRHGAKNADYRGGVTCLYDTQLLGACLHASESGGRYRPEAVRGMPEVPIAPQPRHGGCRLCQPSLFQQGVVGAFAYGFGFLTSDFGVGTSQDLGLQPIMPFGLAGESPV